MTICTQMILCTLLLMMENIEVVVAALLNIRHYYGA
jgi:hypothetical protein